MSPQSRVNVRWPVLGLAALLLIAAGAGGAYLAMRPSEATTASSGVVQSAKPAADPAATDAPATPASTPLPDVAVTLSADAIARAGIVVTTVTAGAVSNALTAPGVVEPNAYKQVVVTPLVAGRISRVAAELGQPVRRGQTLAQIFSPELSEAKTRYIGARAELEAHEQELARTEKLVTLGAASKQELERVHANHTARQAELRSLASRLQLLGLSTDAIERLDAATATEATISVPAPIDGIVTEREANVGVNVDTSARLFTIVDLSTVWVVVDVFEKDFSRIRVGSVATITARAYPDLSLRGRVSYIDPQVNAGTRTAKVRIEVPNVGQQLRLGMFAEAVFGGGVSESTPMVHRSAIQNIGDRTVVYVADPKERGTFIEREVRVGPAAGDMLPVNFGLQTGEAVVTDGSFYVRAERERLRPRASGAAASPHAHGATGAPPEPTRNEPPMEVHISVTDKGFEPDRIMVKGGAMARLIFTRKSDKTCATEVVFPSLNIRRELPLNKPVMIEFTPPQAAEINFTCGMSMFTGVAVAK